MLEPQAENADPRLSSKICKSVHATVNCPPHCHCLSATTHVPEQLSPPEELSPEPLGSAGDPIVVGLVTVGRESPIELPRTAAVEEPTSASEVAAVLFTPAVLSTPPAVLSTLAVLPTPSVLPPTGLPASPKTCAMGFARYIMAQTISNCPRTNSS